MILDNIIIDKNFKTVEDQLLMHETKIKTLAQEVENLKEFIQEIYTLIENFGYDRGIK